MRVHRANLTLLTGLALSVAAHVALIVPAIVLLLSQDHRPPYVRARFDPGSLTPPSPPEEDARLGLDIQTPSTLTWVGYEQYQEHIAALAAMDQAAFTDEPAAAEASAPQPAAEMPPVETPAEGEREPAATPTVEQLVAMQSVLDALGRLLAQARPPDAAATPDDAPPRPADESSTAPASDAKPAPTEPSPATPTPPQPGETADQESDPTSVIDAALEHWKLGQPLAAPGLEVLPRKPEFTILQRLTSAVRNPLCRIRFGRDGVPVSAEIIESSGTPSIDAAIEASLYRWRAQGQRLDELAAGQSAAVTIRIIMRE